MAYSSLPNYVRMYSKRMHLTEREVAHLIGLADGSTMSRYENFHRQPSLQNLLRLLVMFGCSAQELVTGEYEKAQEVVTKNAKTLRRLHSRKDLLFLTNGSPERDILRTWSRLLSALLKLNATDQLPDLPALFAHDSSHNSNSIASVADVTNQPA